MLKDRYHTKYLLQPQLDQVRKQKQKESRKLTNVWKLNNTLKQSMDQRRIYKRNQKILTNHKKNATYQNLWDAVKAGLRGIC